MLLSWRDELRIALSPDRVTLARVSRRGRPKLTAKHTVRCDAGSTSDWRPCIEALQQALQEPSWQDADVSVILSNHFVRYALVPWSEHLVTDDEKRAWVMHHFVEVYGEPSVPTEYRWSDDTPAAPCVASGIESAFLEAIRATFEPTSVRLRSIQPYLMAVFNRWKRRINGASSWIVVPEAGRVCIGAVAHGAWQAITSKSIGADWQPELSLVLERQLLLADAEAPAVILTYGAEFPSEELPSAGTVPQKVLVPRALPGYSPQSDAQYVMALAGVV